MSTTTIRQYRYNYGGNNYPENGWAEEEDGSVKVPLNLEANQKITKLGISAPTGSIVAIGDSDDSNNDFIIGSFETLEFNCNDITISHIWLKQPISAVYDSDGTTDKINEGLSGMDAALTKKLNSSDCSIAVQTGTESVNVEEGVSIQTTSVNGDDIDTTITNTGGTSASIENTFLEEYIAAYNTYLSGIRGVWTTSGNAEIKNILINVVIEETEASA